MEGTSSSPLNYTYAITSTKTSTVYAGELIGYNTNTSTTSVVGATATGSVNASYDATACPAGICQGLIEGQVGGLIGDNQTGTISNSIAVGNVVVSLPGDAEAVGGFIGYNLGAISGSCRGRPMPGAASQRRAAAIPQ